MRTSHARPGPAVRPPAAAVVTPLSVLATPRLATPRTLERYTALIADIFSLQIFLTNNLNYFPQIL